MTDEKTVTVVDGVPYTWWIENLTFIMEFEADPLLRMHPEFDAMVWDQCVRLAHENLLMPVGAVMVTLEDVISTQRPLTEGVSLITSSSVIGQARIKIRAEVLLSG